ncbi:hypothetical protein Pcinc_037442 [Petrolisthes cinctipes]|uniref:Kinesin motor domain-containing protein n=1 Tax=Petrolisthes cinctipes TaxID=88211 RepID=A0AAE1BVQ8_PETCI|nr:hypothetical protein Pcinc_037442 [Petrolisthes cinctipes]
MASPALIRKMRKGNNSQNIKVYVRCRPMNGTESKTTSVVECRNNKELVLRDRPLDKSTKTFTFDRVFGQDSKQIDVYRAVAKNSVNEVLNGFNCTIFAYGQTGTGKTFTMEGERTPDNTSWEEDPLAGIIPRCVTHLFDELRVQNLEFSMRVSFLELYNEELFDLLSAHDDLSKLRLYEDASRKGSCIIQGLEEVLVRSKSDVYSILEKGSAKRQTAATLMNAHSSRSHTVFTVTVHIKENTVDGEELLKTGKLHLVDLAGSENIGRSGAVDKRAREAGNINMSLLTLGRVITSLVEKAPHIPYRESKLTRLLQDALGGRTKTSVIATISPSSINLEETLSTLEYAHRAKNIQNKPEVNQKLNKKELIGEYSNEIERLRRDLMAMREKNGVYLAPENYSEMETKIEMQAQEIIEKITHIRALEEDFDKKKELFNEVSQQLEDTTQKLDQTRNKLENTTKTLSCTQKLLGDTVQERDEQKYLLKAHEKTEEKLKEEGHSLINVASTTTYDLAQLHNKLDRKKNVEKRNVDVSEQFQQQFLKNLENVREDLMAKISTNEQALTSNMAQIGKNVKRCKAEMSEISGQLTFLHNNQASLTCSLLECHQKAVDNHVKDIQHVKEKMNESDKQQESALHSFVQDETLPTLEKMASLITVIDTTITSLHTSVTTTLNTVEAECDAFKKAQSSCLNELQSAVSTSLDVLTQTHTSCVDTLQSSVAATNAHSQDISSSLDQVLEQVVKQIKTVIQSSKDHSDNWSKTVSDKLSNIDHLHTESRQAGERAGELVEQIRQGVVGHTHTLKTHTGQEMKNLDDTVNKVESSVRDLGEQRCGIESAVGRYLNTACNVAADNIAAMAKDLQKMETEYICKLEKTTTMGKAKQEEVSDICMTQRTALINELQRVEKEQDQLESEFNNAIASLGEWSTNHDNQLEGLAIQVSNLVTQDMVKDVPTGQTPVRQEYTFSHTLSFTSPHQRILDRYRAGAVSTISKISLPSFRDDTEDESIASPSSEAHDILSSSSSSCESSQVDDDPAVEIRSRTGSVSSVKDDSRTFIVPVPPMQREREDLSIMHLSRSSSSSSLPDSMQENKENSRGQRQGGKKKRELRQPNIYKSTSSERLVENQEPQMRSKRILSSQN